MNTELILTNLDVLVILLLKKIHTHYTIVVILFVLINVQSLIANVLPSRVYIFTKIKH